MRYRVILLACAALTVSGCLKKQLRHPAEDHHVQAKAIAHSCQTEGFGSGKCTQADIDAMAAQAECIDAITKGEKCGADAEGDK